MIQRVFFPEEIRYRVFQQAFLNLLFHQNIPFVVLFEQLPFFRRVPRQMPLASAVGFRRFAGGAEVSDQVLSFLQLLLLKAQHFADLFQPAGQPVVIPQHHGAAPARRIQIFSARILRRAGGPEMLRRLPAKPGGQTDSLEVGVIGPFQDSVVRQGGQDSLRDRFSAGQIIDPNRPVVHADAEKQNVKVRIFRVAVNAGFHQIRAAPGFNVHTDFFHLSVFSPS